MAPATSRPPTAPASEENGDSQGPRGPHPGTLTQPSAFASNQKIRRMIKAIGLDSTKEDVHRIQGVHHIDQVRLALKLPVRTYATAAVNFHKFRLCFRDAESGITDVANTALFVACKTEDTPKKSRDIICTSYNIKNPDHKLSPDDKLFDPAHKMMQGLERQILELLSFDFSSRYPQPYLVKLVKTLLPDADKGRSFYDFTFQMLIDVYMTYVPLKQSSFTIVVAVANLVALLLKDEHPGLASKINPRRWHTSRAHVVETMLDILDLYTQGNLIKTTRIGNMISLSNFLDTKIALNNEVDESSYINRHVEFCEKCEDEPVPQGANNGPSSTTPNLFGVPVTFVTGNAFNTLIGTPSSVVSPASSATATGPRTGPTRFSFDPQAAQLEQDTVNAFYAEEYEEYEVEVEEDVAEPTPPSAPSGRRGGPPPRGPAYGDGGWGRGRHPHDPRRGPRYNY